MLRPPERLVLERGGIPARAHAWPGDPQAAQIVLLDPTVVPSPASFHEWGRQLAAQGITTIRTGALAPRHAAQAERAGMRCIQELVLLEARPVLAELRALRRRRPGVPTRPCGTGRHGQRDFEEMASVDHAAFGDLWRLDPAMLRDVCAATPGFRARVVRRGEDGHPPARLRRGRPIGFLISGRAARTGYVQRLAVHPEHHRGGIASALLLDALTWMARWRAERVMVNTHVENHAALALYQGVGFTECADRLRVYEGPALP